MFSGPGKADIHAAEREIQELEQRSQTLNTQLEKAKATLAERKSIKAKADAERQVTHARALQLRSVKEESEGTIEQCHEESEELRKECTEREGVLETERAGLKAVEAAGSSLSEAQSSLNEVREEIKSLASDAAKTAALEAAGGDLSTDAVKAPVQALCPTDEAADLQSLWVVERGDGRPLVLPEVRHALRSKAVIVTLQRSLAVKAAEIREGLREWAFTRSAAIRTEELCKFYAGNYSDATNESHAVEEECGLMKVEKETAHSTINQFQNENETLQKELATLLEKRNNEVPSKLQAERNSVKQRFDEFEREHQRLSSEHEYAKKQLDSKNVALNEHDSEATRRAAAAEKLALKAKEQAHLGSVQLEQARHELLSFQQAHAILKEANTVLIDQLVAEEKDIEKLKYDHEKVNLDLNGLARHYMEALPPLPGLDTLLSRPTSVQEESKAFEPPAEDNNLIHNDPVGAGALSVGGRIRLKL